MFTTVSRRAQRFGLGDMKGLNLYIQLMKRSLTIAQMDVSDATLVKQNLASNSVHLTLGSGHRIIEVTFENLQSSGHTVNSNKTNTTN
jgi:hypothetical protein